MFDFYTRFYQAVATSATNAEYCTHVYGRNLCQHGFADQLHLDHLIQVSGISASSRDTEVRLGLQEAIRNIQRELGITTILVTHDLGEAMAMSDRMALLLNGEVVAAGKPEALFHRPPSLAAAQFMGVSTFLNGSKASGSLVTPWAALQITCAETNPRVTYAIRPEHIRLEKETGANSLAGQVTDCVFRGEYIEYQVAVSGMSVRARMPAPMFSHGEQVFMKLPREKLFEVAA